MRASNPDDEVFIVNFNDEYYLDQDFTNNLKQMKEGLEKIDSRGGTALYDAIVASADHLEKNAKLDKRVILVVTDGEDNASRESLEQAIRRLDVENGPTVYTIGLLGDEHQKRARRALAGAGRPHRRNFLSSRETSREVDSITRKSLTTSATSTSLGTSPTTRKQDRRLPHGERRSQGARTRQTARPHENRLLFGPGTCSGERRKLS